jgi:predicted DCC family thiol-disulfide oxidoreductase YuxK
MGSPDLGRQRTPTIYYDGGCPVCSREIAAYRRRPGAERLAWIDAASCPAEALGPDLGRDAALARLHARRADGTLVHGAAAFALLWRQLPAFAWLGRLAVRPAMLRLLDAAYDGFLAVRRFWRKPAAQAAPRR